MKQRELGMKIKFRCPETVGTERCDFVAKGATEDEVFNIIWEHFKTAHDLKPATKPLKHVIRWTPKKGWGLQKQ